MNKQTRIEANLLIHGSSRPIEGGCVVISGREIVYAGRVDAAPPGETTHSVPVAMPGLWDSHCHFFGIENANLEETVTVPITTRTLRSARDAERALMAGVTSVREMGGLGAYLAPAVADGLINGPNIYAAGSILSMTGGHGDIHSLPVDVVASTHDVPDLELCDGIPECLRAVRRQLRKGAHVIKVCASGGVLSELDRPEHAQFSMDELTAIVEEAKRAERVVAAHCHGKAGIMAAVRAGVHTVEHGTFLDQEAARAMADSGVILVSTRFIGQALLASDSTASLPEFARKKLEVTFRRGAEALENALTEGVTVAAGTDILTTGEMWGRNGQELGLLVEGGMSPIDAIKAATATGPLTLGPQAPRTGVLEAGYTADVIAIDSNPLEDISVLGRPESVTHVWRGGDLVKAAR